MKTTNSKAIRNVLLFFCIILGSVFVYRQTIQITKDDAFIIETLSPLKEELSAALPIDPYLIEHAEDYLPAPRDRTTIKPRPRKLEKTLETKLAELQEQYLKGQRTFVALKNTPKLLMSNKIKKSFDAIDELNALPSPEFNQVKDKVNFYKDRIKKMIAEIDKIVP